MSKADDIILDFSVEKDKEDFDAALILKNPFIDEDMQLKSSFSDTLPLKKIAKYYKRIFHLDEKTEDDLEIFSEIQADLDALLDKYTEDDEIPVSELAQIVIKNMIFILQDHCMLKIFPFYSRDRDEIYIKLRATEDNLKVQADLDDYYLQFKKNLADTLPFQQVEPYGPFELKPSKTFVFIDTDIQDFYKHYSETDQESFEGSLFQFKDRVRLIYTTLHTNLDIGLLKSLGILANYLPFHREAQITHLSETWGNVKKLFKRQDLSAIRVYFGEKVAMYFAWLEFLALWFLVPAILGLIFGILDLAFDDTNDTEESASGGEVITIIVALSLPIFAVAYEQMWIRKENELAWRWGTYNIYELEDQRPEFKGLYELDRVSGKMKKQRKITEWYKLKKTLSVTVSLSFVIAVLVCIIALFLYRSTVKDDPYGPTIVGIINAIQIKIFNFIYKYVAVWLNDKENYEYPSEYNDGLTFKLFLFQFINSFTSLFYIAFAKSFFEGCVDNDCISELKTQLATIFITNFCLNAVELYTPFIMLKFKKRGEEKKLKKMIEEGATTLRTKLSSTGAQSMMSPYDTPLSDYMEVVISFGYVILFSASFPLTAPIFFILVLIELKVDALKLCKLTQRPFPDYGNTIGVWLYIVKALVVLSAITNTAIIIFTTNTFELDSDREKWLTFLIIEHVLIGLKYIIAAVIPDMPLVVKDGLEWSARIMNEKLFGRLGDRDKARRERNLEFTEPENRREFGKEYTDILLSDT